MTLSSIISEIQNRVGGSTTDPSESQVTTWVNLGVKNIANRTDWPWTLTTYDTNTTTAGTQEYALQSDFKKMFSVRVGGASSTETDASELTFLGYINKNIPYSDWSSSTAAYYINPTNSKYGLIPTPAVTGDKIYQKYYKIPADISAVSASPLVPSEYHETLIDYSLANYWESRDELDKSVYYFTKFENGVEQMKNDLLSKSIGYLSRMRDIREIIGTEQPQQPNSIELGK